MANPVRVTNEGRHKERVAIHRDIAGVTARFRADEILADLRAATIPATRIFNIRQVRELPQLASKLTRTAMPNGKVIHMQPIAVDVADAVTDLHFPPNYAADTRHVLGEAGYTDKEIEAMAQQGAIAVA